MRPAQIAREIREARGDGLERAQASMRPAQIAREIALTTETCALRKSSFNEARANCAGNYLDRDGAAGDADNFNEARANCAGNSNLSRAHTRIQSPSMRPAQIAREIAHDLGHYIASCGLQ